MKSKLRTQKEEVGRRKSECRVPTSQGALAALVAFCLLPSAFCLTAHAQYAVDWSTIDGGGGTSTSAVYSVSGTIGQPDAGTPLTGGPYTLVGGFWAIAAVQTPGAPVLTIVPDGPGQATISWTPDTPGWVLQETLDLTPPVWSNSPSGSTNPVNVPVSGTMKYYRLFSP